MRGLVFIVVRARFGLAINQYVIQKSITPLLKSKDKARDRMNLIIATMSSHDVFILRKTSILLAKGGWLINKLCMPSAIAPEIPNASSCSGKWG